jgi:phosphate transport system permease protein
MSAGNPSSTSMMTEGLTYVTGQRRSVPAVVLSVLLVIGALGALAGGVWLLLLGVGVLRVKTIPPQLAAAPLYPTVLAAILVALLGFALAWGLWTLHAAGRRRPILVLVLVALLAVGAFGLLVGGVWLLLLRFGVLSVADIPPQLAAAPFYPSVLAAILVAMVGIVLARGLWTLQEWARTAISALLIVGMLYYAVTVVFAVSAEIFAGERVVPAGDILLIISKGLFQFAFVAPVPVAIIYGLSQLDSFFHQAAGERAFADRSIRYLLAIFALSAVFIVFLIIVFTMSEAMQAVQEVGATNMLFGTVWRPGSIIGIENRQLGLMPMIVGATLSTFGAIALGVPLSIGTAILLAEVSPQAVREVVRPAVELLAGIPSVVYGLFGMVVLAPLIREAWSDVPYNTGFGLLSASIILAVMILPTVTNITEDAIRAVPGNYKEASLALGATHWQTIWSVMLPAARSGIVAAVILGIGRALGETMALIMVIGNSIAMPGPLNDNPLSIFLTAARTLTGNIAVEINYAEGVHRSALFFTGVVLFVMILVVNMAARYLMRERLTS